MRVRFAAIALFAVICPVNIMVFALSASLDEEYGALPLAGCRDCKDDIPFNFYECLHLPIDAGDLPKNKCTNVACIEDRVYYAECKQTGSGETDGCNMSVDSNKILLEQRTYLSANPAPDCKNNDANEPNEEVAGIPGDTKCRSPGTSNIRGKCFLAAKCGTKLAKPPFDYVVADKGRLKCDP